MIALSSAYAAVLVAAGVVGFLGNEVVAQYRISTRRRIRQRSTCRRWAARPYRRVHEPRRGSERRRYLVRPGPDRSKFGLLITVAILFVLRDAARELYRRLMDAVEPDLVDRAEGVIRSTPGVVDVTEVRLLWHGHKLLAEAGVTVDSMLSLIEAHHLSHQVEHELVHGVRRLTSATIHAEPLALDADPAHALVSHHG